MIRRAYFINAIKKEDAKRQFEEILNPQLTPGEAASAFDVLVGISLYRADPKKFMTVVLEAWLDMQDKEEEKAKERIENFFDSRVLKNEAKLKNSLNFPWLETKKYITEIKENKLDKNISLIDKKFFDKQNNPFIDPDKTRIKPKPEFPFYPRPSNPEALLPKEPKPFI